MSKAKKLTVEELKALPWGGVAWCEGYGEYDCGEQGIVIRDELRMHAGFFTHRDYLLQLVIVAQRQGDIYLVQFILRKDDLKIVYGSEDFNASV